eukprot:368588-Prymnesium_polylepis.1
MDLEADLASQEMSFAMGDDALVGISIPEVAVEDEVGIEEDDASQLLASQPAVADDDGFGAENNFE